MRLTVTVKDGLVVRKSSCEGGPEFREAYIVSGNVTVVPSKVVRVDNGLGALGVGNGNVINNRCRVIS